MEKSKKSLQTIWIIFGLILLIKAAIVFFRNGPFIFPDEGCIIQRAMHFAATFKIESCEKLLELPVGDAYPLYSIFIAPVYVFFHGLTAYKLILLLNSFIVASLIFPLYGIFNKFIKSNRYCIAAAAITVFLPQFTVFEKTLMSETLYSVLMIWSLFFYVKSLMLSKSKDINKIISVLFAVLTALTRPFGFILLMAIAINELIVSKRKKLIILLYLPISILLASLAIFFFSKGIIIAFFANLGSLTEPEKWKYLIRAISDQINSFTVATFFLPLVIFFGCYFGKGFKKFDKIKYLIMIYIALNFIISAHHIFGYLISLNYSPVLITRYISSSVVLIFISSLIFIHRYKKIKFTFGNTLFVLSLIVSMLFNDASKFGFSLNLEMMSFLDLNAHRLAKDLIPTWKSYSLLLLPVIFLLFLMLLMKNRKILISAGITMIIFFSIVSYATLQNYSRPSALVGSLEEMRKGNIAVIITIGDEHILGEFWRLISLSKHVVRPILLDDSTGFAIDHGFLQGSNTFKEADYVISTHEINLPFAGYTNDGIFLYNQTK